jgi:translocation and assembly module TamA
VIESRVLKLLVPSLVWLAVAVAAAGATETRFTAPGASDDFSDKLRGTSLSLEVAGRADASPQDLVAAAQADYARLTGVLYAAGYYGGVISITIDGREAADIPPLTRLSAVNRLEITVDHGAAFTFSRASLAPRAPGTDLPENFAVGQQARGDLVRQAARAGIDAWRRAGHAKARVAQQDLVADHRGRTLEARLAVAPGPRLSFGTLRVKGDSRVRAKRIRAIAGLPTGEVYAPDAVKDASKRLRRTGVFRSVALQEAEQVSPGDRLDIEAKVADAKPRRAGAGIELSSQEGLTLSSFWLHRNLLGGAERFRVDGEVGGIGGDSGGIDYRLSTRFDRPATFSADTGLFLVASIEELDDRDFRERNIELGGGLTHVFSDRLTGEAGVTLRYAEIDDDLGSRTLSHLLFPARLTWDRRDDTLDPTTGTFLDLEAAPFIGLDESSTGARLFADARAYRAFGANDGVTLAARAQAGSVAGAAISDIPPGMLFFSGGAGTVRGQSYQSLAVDLGGGQRVGGRSFLGFSGEVRADVGGKCQAVAFADTGFIGEDAWGTENGDWHSGAGLGARYATGVGPIRVDVATPLGSDAGQDFEIYIGIGQAF